MDCMVGLMMKHVVQGQWGTNKKRIAKKFKTKKVQNFDAGLENEDSSLTQVFHDSNYEFDDEGELFKKTTEVAKKMADWSAIASHFKTTQNETQPTAEADSNESEQQPNVADSKELHSNASDGKGDEISERLKKYPRFKAALEMDDPKFVVGLLFSSRDKFKKACKHHGVK
ncbi:hypothetical protein ACH5RR_008626 [Cinchona calisaya]|uniref:Uncharacterized protein n=1 Tax=Cinchona calisaya TaxID=153742 RepID=A0ABD3AC49_9GENT